VPSRPVGQRRQPTRRRGLGRKGELHAGAGREYGFRRRGHAQGVLAQPSPDRQDHPGRRTSVQHHLRTLEPAWTVPGGFQTVPLIHLPLTFGVTVRDGGG
jgi:hypothetical protein